MKGYFRDLNKGHLCHKIRMFPSSLPRSFSSLTMLGWEALPMDSQTSNTSLQRLQNVEKRIVRVSGLAGGVVDELCNPSGPRKELISSQCGEFMQLIKDIQVTLREEIKIACEYRPFEKCDYVSRMSNEICFQKLEYFVAQLNGMKETIDDYHNAV